MPMRHGRHHFGGHHHRHGMHHHHGMHHGGLHHGGIHHGGLHHGGLHHPGGIHVGIGHHHHFGHFGHHSHHHRFHGGYFHYPHHNYYGGPGVLLMNNAITGYDYGPGTNIVTTQTVTQQTPAIPPVIDPPMPYSGPLPTLPNGGLIIVSGHIMDKAQSCTIELQTGSELPETALQLQVTFDAFGSSKVTRNSFLNGIWGLEESMGTSPLKQADDFACMILFQDDKYMIALNGAHFCEFFHRMPKDKVSTLSMYGNLTVKNISVQNAAPMTTGSTTTGVVQGGKVSGGCCIVL